MLDSTEIIRQLVRIPGPPGQEEAVREAVARLVAQIGWESRVDAKGNLLIPLGPLGTEPRRARVVVTAHMDEIALMVSHVARDGSVRVVPQGGLHPWKWGEQPVQILVPGTEPLDAVLSLGCVHTNSPASVAHSARSGPLVWDHAFLFSGLPEGELLRRGVRPGVRVALHPERRAVMEMGDYLCAYFLDDRADLAALLLALEELRESPLNADVVFAATASEEVGGEGAAYLLHRLQPDICVALEIGPSVPESPFLPDDQPTIWATDTFASIAAADMEILEECAREQAQRPHWQALSRGGSDASCGAQRGLAARPVTLGLPVENSHGLEIMHRGAPRELARLLTAYLRRVCRDQPGHGAPSANPLQTL